MNNQFPDAKEVTFGILPTRRPEGMNPRVTLAAYAGSGVVFWWLDVGELHGLYEENDKLLFHLLQDLVLKAAKDSDMVPWDEEIPPFSYQDVEYQNVEYQDYPDGKSRTKPEMRQVTVNGVFPSEDWRDYFPMVKAPFYNYCVVGGCGTIKRSFTDWCARIIHNIESLLHSLPNVKWEIIYPDHAVRRSMRVAGRIESKAKRLKSGE